MLKISVFLKKVKNRKTNTPNKTWAQEEILLAHTTVSHPINPLLLFEALPLATSLVTPLDNLILVTPKPQRRHTMLGALPLLPCRRGLRVPATQTWHRRPRPGVDFHLPAL